MPPTPSWKITFYLCENQKLFLPLPAFPFPRTEGYYSGMSWVTKAFTWGGTTTLENRTSEPSRRGEVRSYSKSGSVSCLRVQESLPAPQSVSKCCLFPKGTPSFKLTSFRRFNCHPPQVWRERKWDKSGVHPYTAKTMLSSTLSWVRLCTEGAASRCGGKGPVDKVRKLRPREAG